jgi:hypothetical protein
MQFERFRISDQNALATTGSLYNAAFFLMCSKYAMSWAPTNETVLEGLMNSHFQSSEWEQTAPFFTRV